MNATKVVPRGLLFHEVIIRNPHTNVNKKSIAIRYGVTYHESMPRKKLPPEVLEYFRKQGAKGGKLGGAIRAERMSAEQRSESARKAVLARWEKAKTSEGSKD